MDPLSIKGISVSVFSGLIKVAGVSVSAPAWVVPCLCGAVVVAGAAYIVHKVQKPAKKYY